MLRFIISLILQGAVISDENRNRRMTLKKIYLFLVPAAAAVFLTGLSAGRYHIPFLRVLGILFHPLFGFEKNWLPVEEAVVLNLRLPRVAMAAVSGMGLSVCGAVYQGIFRNPLVSPGVIGVTSGAGFGAALGILLFGWGIGAQLFAFIFGFAALLMTLSITGKTGGNAILVFILAGVVVNMFFQAGISFLKIIADSEDQLPSIVYWLMGSLSQTGKEHFFFTMPLIIISSLLLIAARWRINALSLGIDAAKSLGVKTGESLVFILFFSTLAVSAVVSVGGIVGWVGLIVPHMVRMVVGSDHEKLLPASAVAGAILFMLIDISARIIAPVEIPLGVITAFIGTPVFIYLLVKSKGSWVV